MSVLEYVLRGVGFVTAVLGTCAAVPDATWRLLREAQNRAVRVRDKVLGRETRLQVSSVRASGSAALSGSSTLSATGMAVGNSIEERLDRLEQRVETINQNQQQTAADLREEANERRRTVNELREHVDTEVVRLDRELADQQQISEEINTRALPIVLAGALLTSFPDLLSQNRVLGWSMVLLGLGASVWACVFIRRARKRRQRV